MKDKRNKRSGASAKQKQTSRVLLFLRTMAILLPLPCYLFCVIVLWPAPNSGFILMGGVGAFLMAIPLLSIVGLLDGLYFGHAVTCVSLGISAAMIGISSLIMYTPSLHNALDEQMVSYYFMIWAFLFVLGIWYAFFRASFVSRLRREKISKSRIDALLKGKRNYWWLESLNQAFDLGALYTLNKVFIIDYFALGVLHLIVGWWHPASVIISFLMSLSCVLCAAMWGCLAGIGRKVAPAKEKADALPILGILFPLLLGAAVFVYTLKML